MCRQLRCCGGERGRTRAVHPSPRLCGSAGSRRLARSERTPRHRGPVSNLEKSTLCAAPAALRETVCPVTRQRWCKAVHTREPEGQHCRRAGHGPTAGPGEREARGARVRRPITSPCSALSQTGVTGAVRYLHLLPVLFWSSQSGSCPQILLISCFS